MSDIRINPHIHQIVDLDGLPGGAALYEELADAFIDAYENGRGTAKTGTGNPLRAQDRGGETGERT